jgi:uncharacterized protein YlxW (UPF0749 family)
MDNSQISSDIVKRYFGKPWYYQPWFISILMASFILILPPIVAIGLIIADLMDSKKKKKLIQELNLDKLAALEVLENELSEKIAHSSAVKTLEATQSEIGKSREVQSELQSRLATLQEKLVAQEDTINMQEFGFYGQEFEIGTPAEYKAKMISLQEQQKLMVKNKTASSFSLDFTYNGSKAEGRKMVMREVKIALWAFNTHCDNVIAKVTYRNYALTEKKIRRALEIINENEQLQSITSEYLALKLEELSATYKYKEAIEHEKELLREQREKEREDKKLQLEIASAKASIEKDESHVNTELSRLRAMLADEKSDKTKLNDRMKVLELKLVDLDVRKKDIANRQNNAMAGYVYIISNIGAFGEGVVKIGVTRRLEPLERIKELGDASVPFRFDIHALLFSDSAFQLEAALHKRFAERRLNKINQRKEFFNIPVEDLKFAVEEESRGLVDFEVVPEAREYRESLMLKK